MKSQSRLTEDERADLVAYLDGELDETEAQSLEGKLTRSLSARKEVEALRKTWDLLDFLPRAEAPAEFASQTVTRLQSQELAAELLVDRARRIAVAAVQGLGSLIAVAAAAVAGFVLVRFVVPDPTRDLMRDLHIVENIEAYQQVPDFKFLQELAQLGAFSDSALGATPGPEAKPTEKVAPEPTPPPPSGPASSPAIGPPGGVPGG
jgi:hypothetical protein